MTQISYQLKRNYPEFFAYVKDIIVRGIINKVN